MADQLQIEPEELLKRATDLRVRPEPELTDEQVAAARRLVKHLLSNESEHVASQCFVEGLHWARLGSPEQISPLVQRWFQQTVDYIDDDGPRPDYWPTPQEFYAIFDTGGIRR